MHTLIIATITLLLASIATAANNIPADIVDRIKSDAAASHPGDYSTQLYVVEKQKAAYNELATATFKGCENVLDEIMQKAEESHPYDFSTQLYVVRKNCDSYIKLNQ